MNWLDIFLIIIAILSGLFGLIMLVWGFVEDDFFSGVSAFIFFLVFSLSIGILPFMIIDKASGVTIGTITSVDKNYFGTTAIYIKTSETSQEELCIEDNKIVEKAKKYIGKNVKVEYGTRVGLYSTGKCNQAPIEKIELIEEN